MSETHPNLINLTADIVSAHVSNNKIATGDVAGLIRATYDALSHASAPAPAPQAEPTPVVSARASVKVDYLVCMECGAKQKMLKRHLMRVHGLSPTEYREKYKLPRTYPMVSADYHAQRAELAKASGLGKQTRKATAAVAAPVKKAAKAVGGGLAVASQHLSGEKAAPAKRSRKGALPKPVEA